MDKILINALNGALEKKMSNITMLEGMAVETFKMKVLETCSKSKDSDTVESIVLSFAGDVSDTVALRKLVKDAMDSCTVWTNEVIYIDNSKAKNNKP